MNEEVSEDKIGKASKNLDDAVTAVAHLARELVETAEPWREGEQYLVDGEALPATGAPAS